MNTETPIKKINTSKIVYVSPSDAMMKVEEVFDTINIHHILVLENDILKGVISKNDLLKIYRNAALMGNIPDRAKITAEDIMTKDPITLDIDDSIGLAADIFLSNKIHSIPVMNGADLAGIITNHDIIKFCFK